MINTPLMRLLLICCTVGSPVSVLSQAPEFKNTDGHVTFSHSHSTACGPNLGGVCYGYAMGRAAGKNVGDACDPATMIPVGVCDNGSWITFGINGQYWEFVSDQDLSGFSGGIIRFGDDHVAWCPSGVSGEDAMIYNIRAAGLSPTTETMYFVDGQWHLYIPQGHYVADGYFRKQNQYVAAINEFEFFGTVTNAGSISIHGQSGVSPQSRSLPWGGPYTLLATDNQEYPPQTGYLQKFVRWRFLGGEVSTNLNYNIYLAPGAAVYYAEFYRTAPTTFAPTPGGAIVIDGVTYTTPQTRNLRVENSDPLTVRAQYNVSQQIEHMFSSWTDSSFPYDTIWTSSVEVYGYTANRTLTAHFTARPLGPPNVHFVGSIGDMISIDWDDHECTDVTKYEIWRRVKPYYESMGPPIRIGTKMRGTTFFTDYDYMFASTSNPPYDKAEYDVRSYFGPNGSTSSGNWQTAFANEGLAKGAELDRETLAAPSYVPTQLEVSEYPNPFNPTITIRYGLPHPSVVRISLFNALGEEIVTLVNDAQSAGFHEVQFNGRGLPSGIYIYRVGTNNASATRKVVLTK